MPNRRNSRTEQPVALELLSSDHRKVEALFERYDKMKEQGDDSRNELALRICAELTVHMTVEEELFYPWLREKLDEVDLVEEALVEHSSGKQLIAEIERSGTADDETDAKVKVLGEYIKHHLKEEENEIFPEVRQKSEELDELGQEMHARKAELMAEMGLESVAEDEAMGMEMGAMGGHGRKPSQPGAHRSR